MIEQFSLNILSKIINRTLGLAPNTKDQLKELSGNVIAINITDLNKTFYLFINENGLDITNFHDGECKLTLAGTSFALFGMLKAKQSKDKTQAMFSDDIEIQGSTQFAEKLQQAFLNMDIDWEAHLSKFFGGTLAHKITSSAQKGKQWCDNTKTAMYQNLEEYLKEELQVIPQRDEINEQLDAIDTLRNDAQRLLAKAQQLTNRLNNEPA